MNRILIVEDNALNRALLLAVLKPEGFEILIAEDGLSGVEVAQRERPDWILMDVMLPGPDGYDITRRIKAHEATQHIPIIAITSSTAPAERARWTPAATGISPSRSTRAPSRGRYGCFSTNGHG
jgi:CheY-like chemotaxis protein